MYYEDEFIDEEMERDIIDGIMSDKDGWESYFVRCVFMCRLNLRQVKHWGHTFNYIDNTAVEDNIRPFPDFCKGVCYLVVVFMVRCLKKLKIKA